MKGYKQREAYDCDYCCEVSPSEEDAKAHAKICCKHPAQKKCASCYHFLDMVGVCRARNINATKDETCSMYAHIDMFRKFLAQLASETAKKEADETDKPKS